MYDGMVIELILKKKKLWRSHIDLMEQPMFEVCRIEPSGFALSVIIITFERAT